MVDAGAALTFSEEELFLLGHLLQVTGTPGMRVASLLRAPKAELALVLATTERSLRGRGIIVGEGEGDWRVAPAARRLLGQGEPPAWSLLATAVHVGPVVAGRFYHRYALDERTVEHAVLPDRFHRFVELAGRAAALASVADALCLDGQAAAACPPGLVERAALLRAGEQVREGTAPAARTTLLAGGLPAETAEALVETMGHPVTNGSVLCLNAATGGAQGFALWDAPGGLWIIEPTSGNLSSARVEPATAAAVRERLAALWPTA